MSNTTRASNEAPSSSRIGALNTSAFSSNPQLRSPQALNYRTGPPIIGIILNWWLFGIFFTQYLLYLNHATRRDRKIMQAIVHVLFILDTAQSILAMNDAFRWFVFNFGNYESLGPSGLHGINGPVLDSIIAVIVQLVYCWRICLLSKWRAFPAIIAFFAFVSNVSGIMNGIYSVATDSVDDIKTLQWYIPAIVWLGGSAITDVLIAATMVYLLKFKTRGCSQGVRVLTKRILILTLETNTVTAITTMVTAALSLFPALAPPITNLHRLPGYTLGKLYSNCFMVLLNQRLFYDKRSQEERTTTSGALEFAHNSRSGTRSGITQPDSTGEVESTIEFSEATTQVDFKSGRGDDIELGIR